ncbi:MAG TPA: hypothetical protein VIF62_07040 [Labilithrix sp.]
MLSAAACLFTFSPTQARAEDDPETGRHFYQGYDYGSQALYNPVYVIVNRGFDVLQLAPHTRAFYTQDWQKNLRNVWNNVKDPFPAIRADGWWRFSREEILPLSWTQGTARWSPNYGLHLVGGGQTYAMLREWYLDHDAPAFAATTFSIATLFTAAFLNESIENAGTVGYNTDCLADLYVFDIGGVILFSVEPIRKLASTHFIVLDWSLQPSFTYPHGDLHNQGNYYALKIPVPYYERLRLFGYMGFSNMAGLSYKLDRQYSISAAAGAKVSHLDTTTQVANDAIINMRATAAIFVDRHDSLLASVHVADVPDYFVQLNVYPNAFYHFDPGIGFWGVLAKDGRFMAGVSITRLLGLGIGAGTL